MTGTEFAAALHAEIGALADLLGWLGGSGNYDRIAAEALSMLDEPSIESVVDEQRLLAAGRVALWRAARRQTVSWTTIRLPDGISRDRAKAHEQIRQEAAAAERDAAALGIRLAAPAAIQVVHVNRSWRAS